MLALNKFILQIIPVNQFITTTNSLTPSPILRCLEVINQNLLFKQLTGLYIPEQEVQMAHWNSNIF